ncbi:MAG TPA: glycosyltransferase 87 family protein [Gryllotalpicola sp.]
MPALVRRRAVLWPVFIAVHLVLAASCLKPGITGNSFNDVTGFYRVWVDNALHGGPWPVVSTPWVYPVVALIPMLVPALGGDAGYGAVWLLEVSLLDAAAFGVLIAQNTAPRVRAAWYWLAALLALGPVALGRLDAVSVALAVLGVVALATRPWLAGILLALGTWVKFWPAALIAAAVVAAKGRWQVFAGAVATTAVVAAVASWGLHARFLFSFIGQQSGRGLQIESPFATPLMWAAWAHAHGERIYYDTGIYTFQVAGPGASALAAAADWAMPLAVIAAALLGLRAVLRKAEPRLTTALLGLALTVGFCAFDKVGSPQYHAWFAVPIMMGLMVSGRLFRMPALLVLASTVLTQLIYPWFYDGITGARPGMLLVLTARNALELVVFGWALVALWQVAKGRGPQQSARKGRHS